MFDDQPSAPGAVPANLPTEPEDMLASVDSIDDAASSASVTDEPPDALSAGLLKKKLPSESSAAASRQTETMPSIMMSESKPPIVGKIILVVVVLAVIGGAAYGAYWGYTTYFKKTPSNNVLSSTTTVSQAANNSNNQTVEDQLPRTNTPAAVPVGDATTSNVSNSMKNDEILFGEPVDTDKDSVDDIREKELGTNPNDPDTDHDGLNDGQEVLVWKTDPLNPDTDGDGYPDGKEVQNGYNPLGPGKISALPAGASTSTTSSSKTR